MIFEPVAAIDLPESPDRLANATLDDLTPHYRALAEQPLDDVSVWLERWSRLEALFGEAATAAEIEYDRDTADEAKQQAALRFGSELSPQLEAWRVRLGERLVASGHAEPGLETTLARWRNRIELYREANTPLVSEAEALSTAYRGRIGSMTAEWEGRRLTPSQLRPFAASGDRQVRERAVRAFFRPYVEARDELAATFDRLLELRFEMARIAGFPSYLEYQHRRLHRFDYTPADCLRFHAAVEETVVPALCRIYERRAAVMGLPGGRVRPWDAIDNHVAVPDPLGRPPIRPFTTESELVEHGRNVFTAVDPELGDRFGRLAEAGLLDLMSRPGKAPGAFCATLPFRKLPFVFMNGAGVAGDVDTLLHECGHAFHAFEVAENLPLVFQWDPGSEMDEVASMAMELLARPYLGRDRGGFYEPGDERRARIEHLEELLAGLAHIASVDAFQHWAYSAPTPPDADARDQHWLELRRRFEPGVDWTGWEAERVARWYEQLHFFSHPLYYIEYGIAQLGALQVWRNARRDQRQAVADYRAALALGGSRPLPELYAAAGAELVFDAESMRPLVDLVESELESLRAGEPGV